MSPPPGQTGRRGVWAAGLIVAAGAGVATAHGLYQVATASHVPTPIGWLYPLITDGLALEAAADIALDPGDDAGALPVVPVPHRGRRCFRVVGGDPCGV